jgi:hypothetical protein
MPIWEHHPETIRLTFLPVHPHDGRPSRRVKLPTQCRRMREVPCQVSSPTVILQFRSQFASRLSIHRRDTTGTGATALSSNLLILLASPRGIRTPVTAVRGRKMPLWRTRWDENPGSHFSVLPCSSPSAEGIAWHLKIQAEIRAGDFARAGPATPPESRRAQGTRSRGRPRPSWIARRPLSELSKTLTSSGP